MQGFFYYICPASSNGDMKDPNYRSRLIYNSAPKFRSGYKKVNPGDEGQIERTTIMETFKKVTMKLTCGPVTDHIGGVKSYTVSQNNGAVETREYIQKNIVLNAVYGKPEDNNYAQATPSGKLEFSLTNPGADIFVPGKQYKITLEEWTE